MENAAYSDDIILTEVPNSKLGSSKEIPQYIPVKETGEQIIQVETREPNSGSPLESGTCQSCFKKKYLSTESPSQEVRLVNWTPLKAKLFIIVLGCFVVWAAVFFTLNFYDFL